MSLLRDPRRFGFLWLALAAAVTIVTGCGGSGEPVQDYHPSRLIVFGDELSALTDDGNQNAWKYNVNGIDPISLVRDCNQLQNWVQGLAGHYGFVFAECNPGGVFNLRAVMRALPGARIEDPVTGLDQQISDQLNAGLGTGDLVTVLIGSNDIVDLFALVQTGQLAQTDAMAEARRRAVVLANQVNRLLALNTRVILSTIPDMGKTPFARNADQLIAGSSTLLHNMSYEFNSYLRTRVDSSKYDGRNYGLVLTDDMVAAAVNSPTSYLSAPGNVTDALCVVPLASCTNAAADLTTALGATTNSYLWADDLHPGPVLHNYMASAAVARATTNPF